MIFRRDGEQAMDEFQRTLNVLLTETYRSILKVEEGMLREHSQLDVTITELHMIEAIAGADEQGLTITDIAQDQSLSLPTVTVAINKLVKKGLVEKVKSAKDGRMVHVRCTRLGQRANTAHRYFPRNMILAVTEDLNQAEKEALMHGTEKIHDFFREAAAQLTDKDTPGKVNRREV